MYRVLVGIDTDEERAAAQVSAIESLPAADESVTAILFHAFQDNPEGASVQTLSSVRQVADALEDRDIDYEFYEASGDPATEVIRAAEQQDVDAICLSGRQQTPTGKALFGSVTQDVILGTDIPVLAVGSAQ